MEKRSAVRGSNRGPRAAARTVKLVAEMPEDKLLKDPAEAAAEDGYPGSCPTPQ